MKFIPKLLRLFNYKFRHTSFYGHNPILSEVFSGSDGDSKELVFGKPTKVNMLTMFESGEEVTDFEVFADFGGEMKLIYKQNRIADFRVCAIDELVTSKIKVVIVGTRKNLFRNVEIFAYNLPKAKGTFRKMAYCTVENVDDVDAENIALYNAFNLFSAWKMDYETGEIVCNAPDKESLTVSQFERYLEIIRETVENPEIVATLMCTKKDFVKAIENPKTIPSIVAFVEKYNLDGISFDWEYPVGPVQWRVFDKFIIEVKKALNGKILTLALASWLRYSFSAQAIDSIDFVEVMTYDDMQRDIDGHHSEFFIDGPNAIHNFISKGFRPEQLNLGIPFYGRPVDGVAYWRDYKKEADKMTCFTNVVYDEYQDEADKKIVTIKPRFYNSKQMVMDKTTYAIYAKLAGVMVFHLTEDTNHSNPLCLTNAIDETVKKRMDNY